MADDVVLQIQAVDIGGSMFIHTFGAYFGLAMSYVSRRQQDCQSRKEESSYTSDLFAMIGAHVNKSTMLTGADLLSQRSIFILCRNSIPMDVLAELQRSPG